MTVVSFFSGLGGLDKGFVDTGYVQNSTKEFKIQRKMK